LATHSGTFQVNCFLCMGRHLLVPLLTECSIFRNNKHTMTCQLKRTFSITLPLQDPTWSLWIFVIMPIFISLMITWNTKFCHLWWSIRESTDYYLLHWWAHHWSLWVYCTDPASAFLVQCVVKDDAPSNLYWGWSNNCQPKFPFYNHLYCMIMMMTTTTTMITVHNFLQVSQCPHSTIVTGHLLWGLSSNGL
jgi:hypothetical protein